MLRTKYLNARQTHGQIYSNDTDSIAQKLPEVQKAQKAILPLATEISNKERLPKCDGGRKVNHFVSKSRKDFKK